MAASLVQMGAADNAVDIASFARDLEKIFTAVQVFLLMNTIRSRASQSCLPAQEAY